MSSYGVAANLLYAHSYLGKHVTHSCYFHWDLTLKHTNKNIPEKGVRQDILKHLIRKRKVRHPRYKSFLSHQRHCIVLCNGQMVKCWMRCVVYFVQIAKCLKCCVFCAETQVVEPLLEVIEQFCATSCSTLTAQMLSEALGVLLTQTGVWFRLCCQDDRSPCTLCVNV